MSYTKDNKQVAPDQTGLGNTVEAFSNRIARKLKERNIEANATIRATETRHALILDGMNLIRRALQETSRIPLGDRFKFRLKVDDWEGWPRVQLQLVDALAPNAQNNSFIVSASDRTGLGTIEMGIHGAPSPLAKVNLAYLEEYKRLPLVLKKSVRQFLDSVSNYILNPIRPEDLLEQQTAPIESKELEAVDKQLLGEELFNSDSDTKQNQVQHADEIDELEIVLG